MLSTGVCRFLVNHNSIRLRFFDVQLQFFIAFVHLAVESDGLISQSSYELPHRVSHFLPTNYSPVEFVYLLVQSILLNVLSKDKLTDIIVRSHKLLSEFGNFLLDVQSPIR